MSNMQANITDPHDSLKKMDLALQRIAASGKDKKEADFKEAYPLIEQSMAKKIPFKIVLETFNAAYGYALHPPRFRKMLMDERNRRSMNGDAVTCAACGQKIACTKKTKEEIIDTEVQ